MSPITCAVTTGMPSGSTETVGDPLALPLLDPALAPGTGRGVADGLIWGKRLEAFPAPMSELFALLSSGIGPIPTLLVLPSPIKLNEDEEDERDDGEEERDEGEEERDAGDEE